MTPLEEITVSMARLQMRLREYERVKAHSDGIMLPHKERIDLDAQVSEVEDQMRSEMSVLRQALDKEI
jgi:hypothetical protein